jgi:hypothetical protein
MNRGKERPQRTGSKKSAFQYKPRDEKAIKDRAEQKGGTYDGPFKSGFDTWRPKAGDNTIRILPPTWDDHNHYGYDVWMHRYIGANDGTYICLAKMLNKSCPICAASKEAKAAGEAEEAKDLAPAKLVVCWILDRDEDKQTPLLYAMSWTMDRDIATRCHDKRSGKLLLIDHPTLGYDVTFRREGVGLKTKYIGISIDRDQTKISEDSREQEQILDYILENPIPSVLQYRDADYLEAALSGTVEDKDPDLDDDKPAKRGRADEDEDEPKAKRRARDEDEDDEPVKRKRTDDDDTDDQPRRRARDEDEDDEAPPKKRRRVDDDADADDAPKRRRVSSEDADEDDQPKKRRRVDDDVDGDDAPRKRRATAEEDDDEPTPKKKRVRDADEEDDPPAKRRRVVEEEDDPPPRKRARDDDDDPPPRKRARDEDEDEPPAKRRRPADEDEDEPPRRRRAVPLDDE